MKISSAFVASSVIATLMVASPATAQDVGSMQLGDATITFGGGTAILDLPDVEFSVRTLPNGNTVTKNNDSEDLIDEIGWNIRGAIDVPLDAARSLELSGFWANINDKDNLSCINTGPGTICAVKSIVDNPAVNQTFGNFGPGVVLNNRMERDVDLWGFSLAHKWTNGSDLLGLTQTEGNSRFYLGADIRGIDQDLQFTNRFPIAPAALTNYNEDLDTRYYGIFAAWGRDYRFPFFTGLTDRLGLTTSFLLRGGIYYADTDYSGRFTRTGLGPAENTNLSLSNDEVTFIGGLVHETRMRLNQRMTLSFKSEYEYYSYVPDMRYNDRDVAGGLTQTGLNNGTSIGSDGAFSAKTSLRLIIKLGPDDVLEPMK